MAKGTLSDQIIIDRNLLSGKFLIALVDKLVKSLFSNGRIDGECSSHSGSTGRLSCNQPKSNRREALRDQYLVFDPKAVF